MTFFILYHFSLFSVQLSALFINTHLPPLSLPDRQLHSIAVQSQVQRCYGNVLWCVADAHGSMVTVSQQCPGSLGNGGSRPRVAVHQRLHRHQVVEQILQSKYTAASQCFSLGNTYIMCARVVSQSGILKWTPLH